MVLPLILAAMPPFWEIVSLLLMAGFKFMVAVFMAFAYGWGIWYSIAFLVLGGMLGVTVFIFFGTMIKLLVRRWFPALTTGRNVERKRIIIERVRRWSGLAGIALLTPVFLTVPVGTFAAVGLGYRWPRIMVFMFIAFSFWSFFFVGLYMVLGIDLPAYIDRLLTYIGW